MPAPCKPSSSRLPTWAAPRADHWAHRRLQQRRAAPAADPATAAKEAAAAKAAGEWLKLIDGAEYGKAWDESASVFRERVTRQQWVDGVPKNRSEFGAFKSRTPTGTAYRTSIPGAPEGEYVMVRFTSDFEKNPASEEVVTVMLQSGAWRPVGYLLR